MQLNKTTKVLLRCIISLSPSELLGTVENTVAVATIMTLKKEETTLIILLSHTQEL